MRKSRTAVRLGKFLMVRRTLFCRRYNFIRCSSSFTTGGLQPISSSWRRAHWDSRPDFFFVNWTTAVIVLMWYLLWREDGSVIYNCCWSSPVHSFSGPSLAGLMTTFYCLRFETPPTWSASPRIYIPQEQGGPVIPPALSSLSVPFTTRRAMVEVIRTLLHTLEGQSAMSWRINSRRTEYKAEHSRLL
jgi:hypothetical protein